AAQGQLADDLAPTAEADLDRFGRSPAAVERLPQRGRQGAAALLGDEVGERAAGQRRAPTADAADHRRESLVVLPDLTLGIELGDADRRLVEEAPEAALAFGQRLFGG